MSEGIGLVQIARVNKSNGTEGGLILSFKDFSPEDIDTQEPVFIYMDGLPVPFFIEDFTVKGQRALVTLTDIHSLDDAEELVGQDIYINEADYGEIVSDEEEDLSDIVGWALLNEDGAKVGTIADYEDIPGNPCIYADTAGGQSMIPFHEDLILSVDEERREIAMRIPEGLI